MTLRSEAMDTLFKTILNLESIDECYAYFEDLCTIKELQDMSQRLETAILLSEGASYQEITQRCSISTATIGRVSKCLNYGRGGYRSAIEKLKEEEK
jgi:TrpR-related protein YerC/YecD